MVHPVVNADDVLSYPEYDDLTPKSNYEWLGRMPKWTGSKRYRFEKIINEYVISVVSF